MIASLPTILKNKDNLLCSQMHYLVCLLRHKRDHKCSLKVCGDGSMGKVVAAQPCGPEMNDCNSSKHLVW